jgi:hypothetical protein
MSAVPVSRNPATGNDLTPTRLATQYLGLSCGTGATHYSEEGTSQAEDRSSRKGEITLTIGQRM